MPIFIKALANARPIIARGEQHPRRAEMGAGGETPPYKLVWPIPAAHKYRDANRGPGPGRRCFLEYDGIVEGNCDGIHARRWAWGHKFQIPTLSQNSIPGLRRIREVRESGQWGRFMDGIDIGRNVNFNKFKYCKFCAYHYQLENV